MKKNPSIFCFLLVLVYVASCAIIMINGHGFWINAARTIALLAVVTFLFFLYTKRNYKNLPLEKTKQEKIVFGSIYGMLFFGVAIRELIYVIKTKTNLSWYLVMIVAFIGVAKFTPNQKMEDI